MGFIINFTEAVFLMNDFSIVDYVDNGLQSSGATLGALQKKLP